MTFRQMYSNHLDMRFTRIEPGKFMMGSPPFEVGRDPDENLHTVRLTKPYYIQTTPVTNAQFRAWRAGHDSGSFDGVSLNGEDLPVVNVSWDEAQAFVAWLSANDPNGVSYRLPSEAQWEFAARAGSADRFWWGQSACYIANYANVFDAATVRTFPYMEKDFLPSDSGYAVTSPVGSFLPNPWGLYDLIGNVWEMCSNWAYGYPRNPDTVKVDPEGPANGGVKVARGGDYLSIYLFARLANRTWTRTTDRLNSMGFRVACDLTPGASSAARFDFDRAEIDDCIASHISDVGILPTWEDHIQPMFTEIDIDHMKLATEHWGNPMHLDDYESVKLHNVRIYSSVRNNPPRMPPPPHEAWSEHQRALFHKWVLIGCPKDEGSLP